MFSTILLQRNGTRKIAPWKTTPQKIAPTLTLTQTLTLSHGKICLGAIFRKAIFRSPKETRVRLKRIWQNMAIYESLLL